MAFQAVNGQMLPEKVHFIVLTMHKPMMVGMDVPRRGDSVVHLQNKKRIHME